ncbi:polysaccharide deacetylase family protein [Salimicrobium sp. PL1-032A]|uniref:polysaccharide deacetylase family protein n=1 Tax=Salimicrobium sp. PL1-032A TaxID=3095364 RepID=UPI003261C65C
MRIWMLVLLMIFLAACNSTGDSSSASEGQAKEKASEEQEEAETSESTEVQNEEQNEETEKKEVEDETPTAREPQYIMEEDWSFSPIDDAEEKVALLTIDDAPDTHALDMAEKLKEKDAPAIFFVNGHFLDTPEEKEMLKQIHDMGFSIGNHTMTHASLTDLSKEEQKQEIVKLSDLIENITGERPDFFRAPFGQNTDYSKQLVKEEEMLLMNWTYGYDWNEEYTNADALADIMVNTPLLRGGANLLMHDREWTNNALDDIIDGLRKKEYMLLDPKIIQHP